MADDLTIILRASGEAPADALRTPMGDLFARLVMRLTELRRAEAALFATSFADPAHAARLARSENLWQHVTDLLGDACHTACRRGTADGPLVSAMDLMDRWLQLQPGRVPVDAGAQFAAEAARILPRGESVVAYQASFLISLAFDCFRDLCGIDADGPRPGSRDASGSGGPLSDASWTSPSRPARSLQPGPVPCDAA